MFTQNSISKDLQDSILKVMEGNIKHPNQQKIDVHEPEKDEITADDFKKLRKMPKPMKEATKIIVHDDEAEDKKLIKKMIDKEKKVDEATAQKMGHAGKVTMKHVNASNASPQVKAAIKKAAPDIKTYGDRAAALNAAGIKREEVEFEESVESNDTHFAKQSKKMQDAINLHLRKGKSYKEAVAASKVHVKEEVETLDELSKSTLGSYAKKASRDAVITRKIGADFENQAKKARSPGMKAASGEISQKYKEKSWKRRDGVDKAVDRLTKEEVEQAETLHPDAKKLLKHIKPEHHHRYTPELTTKHYDGSDAARRAVVMSAFDANHLKEEVESVGVKHEQFGAGKTLPQFAEDLSWIDVMFDEGIKRVDVEDLELTEEKAVHPDAIHVSNAGGGKYKVHAVGSNFSHGVKVGEHLTDTHLDDFSEMGGKVKTVKAPKKD